MTLDTHNLNKKNTGAKPVGRPSKLTPEMADNICERIANGESLRNICRDADMPSKNTVLRWANDNSEFRDQYARAREEQEHFYFEDLIEIADCVVPDAAEVAKARVQIDARKWVLSRMNPKKYGDRIQQEVSGSIESEVTLIERIIVDPNKNETGN